MIGETLSRYRVVAHLGSGAMGDVYRAEDVRLRRPVAAAPSPSCGRCSIWSPAPCAPGAS
jgi:serine/threonine protein kinase